MSRGLQRCPPGRRSVSHWRRFFRKALDKMLATASTTRFTLLDKHSEGVTGILSCCKSNQCTLGDRSGEGMSAAAFREITK